MCFSGPSAPAQQAPPPVATAQDPLIQAAMDADRRRRQSQGGYASTILASQTSQPGQPTQPKTLLGA